MPMTTLYLTALSYSSELYADLKGMLEEESQILIDWFEFNCMQANPDKFQAIAVGKKTFSLSPSFNISNTTISCEETVKLLGIDLDCNLSFNIQITKMCRKAAQQLNILKRIGKYLNKLNKITIFHTFILSAFNYCPMTWHFCSKENINRMEKIQERALRFVYEDYSSSYNELLSKIKLPILHVRRMRTMAIETFNIVNKLSPPVLHDLLQRRDSKYNFRYSNILKIPSVRTSTYGKNSFRCAAPVLWNSSPEEIRSSSNFNQFKQLISLWNGHDCKCNICV